VRLHWAFNNSIVSGNGYGYTSASVRLRDAVAELGVEISESADIAVHFCHPNNFYPVAGKRNVIFTMYEGAPVPPEFGRAFALADLIVVPSKFCASLFEPDLRATRKRAVVVPLGFDPQRFRYEPPTWEPEAGKPFVFLHLGAVNGRKGTGSLIEAWSIGFQSTPWLHLYLKHSLPDGVSPRFERVRNVTFDTRAVPDDELLAIYRAAHCLVIPSQGEGWGLPMLEAQAIGLPVITTRWSGQLDFLDDSTAWFCRHKFVEVINSRQDPFRAAVADSIDLATVMARVVERYPVALKKAARGAARAHSSLTWAHCAKRLLSVLERDLASPARAA
jgi:glycosyltransferase involved in cell wall biosynthesis